MLRHGWRPRDALQTVSFLAFLAFLISAIFLFWQRLLSDMGNAITATLVSLMLVAGTLVLAYGLAEGRI
jgi:hypothetical protein